MIGIYSEKPRLSDLIRRGSQKTVQGFSGTGYMDQETQQYHACALGAALIEYYNLQLAPNMRPDINKAPEMLKDLGIPTGRDFIHPVGKNRKATTFLLGIIMSLNDIYKWTREQIADWVESQGY